MHTCMYVELACAMMYLHVMTCMCVLQVGYMGVPCNGSNMAQHPQYSQYRFWLRIFVMNAVPAAGWLHGCAVQQQQHCAAP
jgi:hypothetical protein